METKIWKPIQPGSGITLRAIEDGAILVRSAAGKTGRRAYSIAMRTADGRWLADNFSRSVHHYDEWAELPRDFDD